MKDTRRRRLVLVVLLLVSLTLIALGGGSSGPGKAIRSVGASVFGPVQRVVAGAFRPVHDFFGGLDRDDRARLAQLEKENAQLRLQERASQYAQSRAAELDQLLRIAGLGQYTIVPAQVISIGPAQGFAETALLDAGSLDGLKVGMTVMNGDGLVGRIKALTSGTATVLLAIDPQFTVGCRLEGSLKICYASGEGSGQPMQLTAFDPYQQMAPGDRVVTNQDVNFPGGIPIGQLVGIHGAVGAYGRYATLQPYVDFTALDLVGVVVVPPRTDPRDSVLPPRPSPSPSPSSTASPGGTASGRATPTPGHT
jgi:rod shape-determining protein MreC